MKKRYPFTSENRLRVGLAAIIFTTLSLAAQAQVAPLKQWDKTFGGNDIERFACLDLTSDGGYILGGYSMSGSNGDKSLPNKGPFFTPDYWILKVDASGTKQWDKSFGGNDDDRLSFLQHTADGGYILGGNSSSGISGDKSQPSRGNSDYWIVKLDSAGNKQWDKTFGGNSLDALKALQQTSDGGYILGGFSISGISGDKTQPSNGSNDFWVLKLDSNGNKLWDKTIGGNNNDYLGMLRQTADGGYILGGESNSGLGGDKSQLGRGGRDFWIVKLDVNGNKTWDKTFGGNDDESIYSIIQTSDGGYISGGYSNSGVSGDKSQATRGAHDIWVVKVDATGNKIWEKAYGGNDYEGLSSILQSADGGYILGGSSLSGISGDKTQASQGSSDFWVVRLDGSGNKIWDKTIGGNKADGAEVMRQTTDGGFIIGGTSGSDISGDKTQAQRGGNDYWVVKLGAEILGLKEPVSNSNLSIFPNPNQGKFTLQLNNLTSPKAEINISDLLGRTIFQQEFKTSNNQLSEEITLPNAKGIYLLQLKTGKQIITRKVMVK